MAKAIEMCMKEPMNINFRITKRRIFVKTGTNRWTTRDDIKVSEFYDRMRKLIWAAYTTILYDCLEEQQDESGMDTDFLENVLQRELFCNDAQTCKWPNCVIREHFIEHYGDAMESEYIRSGGYKGTILVV